MTRFLLSALALMVFSTPALAGANMFVQFEGPGIRGGEQSRGHADEVEAWLFWPNHPTTPIRCADPVDDLWGRSGRLEPLDWHISRDYLHVDRPANDSTFLLLLPHDNTETTCWFDLSEGQEAPAWAASSSIWEVTLEM